MAQSKRSGRIVLILVVLAALGAGTWYYLKKPDEAPTEYATTPLARAEIVQAVTATGALQPVVTVDVGSQISGIIDKVLVDYNSQVKQGEVIAHIDDATYVSHLRSADADLANALASQKLAKLNTDRTDALQKKGLVPQSDLDQAIAQLAQADAQVQTRVAAVESAKVDLSRCTIYSPIDGVVLSRQIDVGKTVAASFNTPVLFTIANDLTKMQIVGAIAEADVGNVAVGEAVNFTVDAFPGRQFHGRVSSIRNSPETVQNVVTYDTIIDVNNDDQKLRPGMTANISVVIARRPAALRIPNNALRVRLPDVPPPAAPENPAGTASAALKPLPPEQRRAYLAKAGFTPGGGWPGPEVINRARELAKADGYEWPEWGGRGGNHQGPAAPSNAPTHRVLYRMVGKGEAAHPEAVNVLLGITDGTGTEVISGLAEGDLVITSAYTPTGAENQRSANPFRGGRRF
ncbi:MAG TPA: efflux RND transporter periplasmic adaptor subunit [Opitutus sp.]|nr:efflux RND transporter periplasmic adaptor subunit [Opitutus sp.]